MASRLARLPVLRALSRRPVPPILAAHCRACSTDSALSSALASVAARIKQADPSAAELPPGVRSAGAKMILRFTCTNEGAGAPEPGTVDRTQTKTISKHAYENGARLLKSLCARRS